MKYKKKSTRTNTNYLEWCTKPICLEITCSGEGDLVLWFWFLFLSFVPTSSVSSTTSLTLYSPRIVFFFFSSIYFISFIVPNKLLQWPTVSIATACSPVRPFASHHGCRCWMNANTMRDAHSPYEKNKIKINDKCRNGIGEEMNEINGQSIRRPECEESQKRYERNKKSTTRWGRGPTLQNRPRRSRDRKLKYSKLMMCILLRAAMSYESNLNWINPIPASKSFMQIVCGFEHRLLSLFDVKTVDRASVYIGLALPVHWTSHGARRRASRLANRFFSISSSSQHLILLFFLSIEKWNEIRQLCWRIVCSICFCAGN